MNQLKQELKAAQDLLQQEPEDRVLEKKKVAVNTSVPVEQRVHPDTQPASPVEQAPVSEPDQRAIHFTTDMQGDLAMFEEVKDLYAEDLFASRRWNAAASQPSTDLFPEAASWHFSSAERSHPPDNSNVSTLELSLQEAIERDMEILLRLDSLQ